VYAALSYLRHRVGSVRTLRQYLNSCPSEASKLSTEVPFWQRCHAAATAPAPAASYSTFRHHPCEQPQLPRPPVSVLVFLYSVYLLHQVCKKVGKSKNTDNLRLPRRHAHWCRPRAQRLHAHTTAVGGREAADAAPNVSVIVPL
jgi:hypothetical protein